MNVRTMIKIIRLTPTNGQKSKQEHKSHVDLDIHCLGSFHSLEAEQHYNCGTSQPNPFPSLRLKCNFLKMILSLIFNFRILTLGMFCSSNVNTKISKQSKIAGDSLAVKTSATKRWTHCVKLRRPFVLALKRKNGEIEFF